MDCRRTGLCLWHIPADSNRPERHAEEGSSPLERTFEEGEHMYMHMYTHKCMDVYMRMYMLLQATCNRVCSCTHSHTHMYMHLRGR